MGKAFPEAKKPNRKMAEKHRVFPEGIDIAFLFVRAAARRKAARKDFRMLRLFSVYKVENGEETLLGGLVERRKAWRSDSDRSGLERVARKKFEKSADEGTRIVLREER